MFTILYMAMILDENKTIEESANFMKKMKWQEIDELCRQRGF